MVCIFTYYSKPVFGPLMGSFLYTNSYADLVTIDISDVKKHQGKQTGCPMSFLKI
jgi:hypothetical protein